MTSTIGVKKVQYPNGTNAITIASDGTLTTDSDLTIGGHTSIGGELTVSPSNTGNNVAKIKTGSTDARLAEFDQTNPKYTQQDQAMIGLDNGSGLHALYQLCL